MNPSSLITTTATLADRRGLRNVDQITRDHAVEYGWTPRFRIRRELDEGPWICVEAQLLADGVVAELARLVQPHGRCQQSVLQLCARHVGLDPDRCHRAGHTGGRRSRVEL